MKSSGPDDWWKCLQFFLKVCFEACDVLFIQQSQKSFISSSIKTKFLNIQLTSKLDLKLKIIFRIFLIQFHNTRFSKFLLITKFDCISISISITPIYFQSRTQIVYLSGAYDLACANLLLSSQYLLQCS